MSNEAINNLDQRSRGTEIAKTAEKLLPRYDVYSERLQKLSIDPISLVRPDDPNDIYDMERVRRDLRWVEERKQKFKDTENIEGPNGMTEGEIRKLAEIAEYQVMLGINGGNWLPNGRAIKTSEFDDIYYGVDLVVEFGGGNSPIQHLGMGVDVSFSHNLNKKFQRIKDDIDRFNPESDEPFERMGVVKYFQSKAGGMKRGELSGLPRVVTAFDLGVMEDLERTKSDDLNGHIAQATLIAEMESQLNTYADYADDVNPAAATEIKRAQTIIKYFSEQLQVHEKLEQSEYAKNKAVDEAIANGLRIFR